MNIDMFHVACLCQFYTNNMQTGRIYAFFLVAILDVILNLIISTAYKTYIQLTPALTPLLDLVKTRTSVHFQFSVINSIVGNLYLVDILDASLKFFLRLHDDKSKLF